MQNTTEENQENTSNRAMNKNKTNNTAESRHYNGKATDLQGALLVNLPNGVWLRTADLNVSIRSWLQMYSEKSHTRFPAAVVWHCRSAVWGRTVSPHSAVLPRAPSAGPGHFHSSHCLICLFRLVFGNLHHFHTWSSFCQVRIIRQLDCVWPLSATGVTQ